MAKQGPVEDLERPKKRLKNKMDQITRNRITIK